ncbi:MAG: CpaF family protein [Eubacterium sp.]|jgi:pilus assembly protein CpaF|nr:CpaF family protein [Eubacterium sp.]
MTQEMEQLRQHILAKLDLTRETADEELEELIYQEVGSYSRRQGLSLKNREQFQREIYHSLRKLDVLQELADDPEVTEIMVNGSEHIFFEKGGRMQQWDRQFYSREKLEDVIQQIAAAGNKIVNEANPIADTRLKDGSRVNIVLSPVAIDGSAVTIRKFPEQPMDMEQLIRLGAISREAVDFLKQLVQAGYNIFVSGGTGAGKTTFLNALSAYIPKGERVITIEDSAELQITSVPNLIRLETRTANMEGVREITIRDLIRASLRMRPDRIIVGECRGAEALDMLQAMNTGHDGSISTGHANSSHDMLKRLETMVLMGMDLPVSAIRSQIASGIDLVIHLGRLRDCSRKVLNIDEIDGMEDGEIQMHAIYRFVETKQDGGGEKEGKVMGLWEKTGELQNKEKLREAGLC